MTTQGRRLADVPKHMETIMKACVENYQKRSLEFYDSPIFSIIHILYIQYLLTKFLDNNIFFLESNVMISYITSNSYINRYFNYLSLRQYITNPAMLMLNVIRGFTIKNDGNFPA